MKQSTRKMLTEIMQNDKIPYDRAHGGDRWEYNPQEDMPFMKNQMRDYAGGGGGGGDQMMDGYGMGDGNYGGYEGYDGRRGVKGTGRYGIGGSQHYGRRDRMMDGEMEQMPNPDARLWRRYGAEDNEGRTQGTMPMQGEQSHYDYARRDMRGDYAEDGEIRIKDEDLMKWKQTITNEDGTRGERFSLQEIMPVAQQMGVSFDKFTAKEFCMVVNMLYSDMCKIWHDVLTPENELHHYVAAAKQWLTDKDALKGSEKLAAYYYVIIEGANEQDGSYDFRRGGMSRR